jgi:hypothetical protein
MDDLVKRLRGDDICDYDAVDELCNEAADCIEQLQAALREIADTHIPDQPAAAYGDGEYWAREQHTKLRRIALAALGENKE